MIKQFTVILFLSFMVTAFSGCKEDDPPADNGPSNNVYEIISAKQGYALTVQAVDKAGLKDLLSGSGPITFLAPSDDALLAAGVDINAMTANELKDLLSYHMMDGKYNIDNIPNGGYLGSRLLDTTNARKISIYLRHPAGVIEANGKQVLQMSDATNGYVLFLNDALKPLSVYGHLIANKDLSIYLTAVQIETNIKAIHDGPANVTVFASNQKAMETWLNAESKTITSIHPDKRRALLNNSTITGEGKLAIDLLPTESTLGQDLTITNGGTTLDGTINVVTKNIQATNGVMHIIDGVKVTF